MYYKKRTIFFVKYFTMKNKCNTRTTINIITAKNSLNIFRERIKKKKNQATPMPHSGTD